MTQNMKRAGTNSTTFYRAIYDNELLIFEKTSKIVYDADFKFNVNYLEMKEYQPAGSDEVHSSDTLLLTPAFN